MGETIEQMLTLKNNMMEVTEDREWGENPNGNEEEKLITPTKEEVFKIMNNLEMNRTSGLFDNLKRDSMIKDMHSMKMWKKK